MMLLFYPSHEIVEILWRVGRVGSIDLLRFQTPFTDRPRGVLGLALTVGCNSLLASVMLTGWGRSVGAPASAAMPPVLLQPWKLNTVGNHTAPAGCESRALHTRLPAVAHQHNSYEIWHLLKHSLILVKLVIVSFLTDGIAVLFPWQYTMQH